MAAQPWLPAYGTAAPAPLAEGETEAVETSSLNFWQKFVRVPLLLPILLLIAAYLLSTLFGVARFVSWWGSYQRLQGTYTFLSYITIALMTMAHLRRPDQIRRLQHVIVLTSLPIAIYGVIQHLQVDPLPWGGDTTTRVASNAGNAIFLAAYLIMAFFFTLERVYSSFAYLLGYKPPTHADSQDIPTALAGGSYLFVLMVQLITIFWTQSRGRGGAFLWYLPLCLTTLYALRPKNHRIWTSVWIGCFDGAVWQSSGHKAVALGWVFSLASISLFSCSLRRYVPNITALDLHLDRLGRGRGGSLVLMNTTSLFSGLRSVPYVGRLSTHARI